MTKKAKMQLWHRIFASVLVVLAEVYIAVYVGYEVQKGALMWQAYPAFMLLVILLFAIDGYLSRDEDGRKKGAVK